MPSSDNQPNQVLTYDGHRAMQKPRVVIFENTEYEITQSESLYISTGEQSDSPVKRGFHVRCKGGRQFELELTEGVGWKITALPCPYLED